MGGEAYAVVGGAQELLLVDRRVPEHTERHGALLEAVLTLNHDPVLRARAHVVLVLRAPHTTVQYTHIGSVQFSTVQCALSSPLRSNPAISTTRCEHEGSTQWLRLRLRLRIEYELRMMMYG